MVVGRWSNYIKIINLQNILTMNKKNLKWLCTEVFMRLDTVQPCLDVYRPNIVQVFIVFLRVCLGIWSIYFKWEHPVMKIIVWECRLLQLLADNQLWWLTKSVLVINRIIFLKFINFWNNTIRLTKIKRKLNSYKNNKEISGENKPKPFQHCHFFQVTKYIIFTDEELVHFD